MPSASSPCAMCGKDAASKCASCKRVAYCSKECQKSHWKSHKAECKKASESSSGPVFKHESEMMAQLAQMGLSKDLIDNLSPEQRKRMMAMTSDPSVVAKARARVHASAAEESARAAALGIQGRSADGSAVPVPGTKYAWRDEKAQAVIEVECPEGTATADLDVTIAAERLSISVHGEVIVDGELFQSVDAEASSWALSDVASAMAAALEGVPGAKSGLGAATAPNAPRTLVVTLVKAKPMRWLMIVRS